MGVNDGNPDPSVVGRRSNDGDFISFREAVKMFATKDEITGMRTSIVMIASRVDALPPREELAVRWQRDDEYKRRFEESLEKVNTKLDDLRSDRLPRWFLPLIAVFAPLVFGALLLIVQHFWVAPK